MLEGKIKGLSFYFFVFLQVKTQTLKMTIVGGLRIIDSNAQTGTMWWNWRIDKLSWKAI
ncbi:hypothetical protein AZO1586R_662 [Bathymodiolus azoricus thioautotrophic gill symbiont]|uniref:Uncharacterized protein n=1 Tax=Bathymodiolus azoricus thioautotrophic gill symbiont TaxID=235205 RepID=A0ACA8ZNU8_9GAMM|nr:hypothetical protein [Bathymodiolus azoricus thioautotrophic gill symbiont]CAB5497833.1 hypothetical protein AZO1586R_662 [Bathymodiolus azoricus thioautotrophic gill symbiont]